MDYSLLTRIYPALSKMGSRLRPSQFVLARIGYPWAVVEIWDNETGYDGVEPPLLLYQWIQSFPGGEQ